ncbi:hypothetical protein BNJ_00022 [Kaumoebavirus]|uniref:hypothetical protein n=1 Tax=Kaumoebavirus TaxID=1859492 RepID=UPI0009C32551|nr:hypothetical protein BNJ_00022 [Kaumoebavirus]ARA71865.1 hypothetical protein BNJ_00022 [Kaumoebavirus]
MNITVSLKVPAKPEIPEPYEALVEVVGESEALAIIERSIESKLSNVFHEMYFEIHRVLSGDITPEQLTNGNAVSNYLSTFFASSRLKNYRRCFKLTRRILEFCMTYSDTYEFHGFRAHIEKLPKEPEGIISVSLQSLTIELESAFDKLC